MFRSMIVIDDFYADPESVRRRALACDYAAKEQILTYPGHNAVEPFLPEGLDRIASVIVGEDVKGFTQRQSHHGKFRVTLEGEKSRYQVHVDPSSLWWVGVVYLTLPAQCQGGTAFYRHKKLGYDSTPPPDALAAAGYPDVKTLLAQDGPDLDKWEHLMTVPMRFNRLILYRPWMWHSAAPGFGDSPETGRLIQVLSFEKVAAA